MRKHLLALPLLLLSAGAITPALAQRPILQPVAREDLSRFVGTNLHGRAYANLGVVSAVDRRAGVIGLHGPYGEYALIHTSVLARNGLQLRAPTLSIGDVRRASDKNMARRGAVIINPTVEIEEGPFYPESAPYSE